ncbi:hypothetical protein [Reyranella sp. CPCC 100927]|uniref:hypothetical protein n=1 Tax=Reyranella sp. CPCC 100927 TaxID=2599616 RepID=UPI0011B66606|nr:hypothetical protein [Reyranella sp. CPCC 100927]TWT05100.1 hypothetical protein FQU96_25990 [Reyranella sp. CPCC 100927]
MRRLALFVLLLLVAALPAAAQRTELYDGTVSLQLPAGFRPMTPAEITLKYPRSQPPQFAFTSSDGLTQTIAVSRLRFPPGSPPPLGDLGNEMQRRVALQTGAVVHRHGLVEIGSRQWYAIEFQSPAADQPVENIMRVTMANDHIIILTANVVSRLFAENEAMLRQSVESVVVR